MTECIVVSEYRCFGRILRFLLQDCSVQGKVSVLLYEQVPSINRQIPYPAYFNPEDGGIVLIRNVGISLQDYTLSQPIKS